jgi:hypothetical protein
MRGYGIGGEDVWSRSGKRVEQAQYKALVGGAGDAGPGWSGARRERNFSAARAAKGGRRSSTGEKKVG